MNIIIAVASLMLAASPPSANAAPPATPNRYQWLNQLAGYCWHEQDQWKVDICFWFEPDGSLRGLSVNNQQLLGCQAMRISAARPKVLRQSSWQVDPEWQDIHEPDNEMHLSANESWQFDDWPPAPAGTSYATTWRMLDPLRFGIRREMRDLKGKLLSAKDQDADPDANSTLVFVRVRAFSATNPDAQRCTQLTPKRLKR